MKDQVELSAEAKSYIEDQLRTRVNRTISIFGVVLGIGIGFIGFWTTQQTNFAIPDLVVDQIERQVRVSAFEVEKTKAQIEEQINVLSKNLVQSRDFAKELNASMAQASDEIAQRLLESQDFAASIRSAVASAPTEGLLSKAEYERQNEKLTRNAEALQAEVRELKRIYDALDVTNTERALAVWDLRKDLNQLSSALATLQQNTDKQLLKIDASIKAETARIYDLGKWFFAIILAASVAPLLERFFTYRKAPKVEEHAVKSAGKKDEKET